MIVDDNPQIRGLYRRLLSKDPITDYSFSECGTAEEGLELYKQKQPDCILLDYSMPGMNGLEFLKKLADNSGFVPVPVVMISGEGDERLAVEAMKRGASDYIVKNSVEKEAIQLAITNAVSEAEEQRRINHKFNRFSSGAFLNIVPGTIIADRYTVIRCLGAGAMGKVYICRDEDLNGLPVAMKVLFSDVSRDEVAIKRFRNEILAAYTVAHENVVRALHYFSENDLSAFTMEYVNGGNLADRIAMSEEMPIADVVDFTMQICAGVQAIHDSSIIHRDLKPSNILLSTDGQIKITDFGIARSASAEQLTQSGSILGTLSYLSPEYLASATVSPQSDIYSIGIIAYEMVTGVLPDDDMNIFTALKSRVEQDPAPPHEIRPDCPLALSEIIMKALRRDPKDRYQNARDMRADLSKL